MADVDALGFCWMSHTLALECRNLLTDRQLHFILCWRLFEAGKPQAPCSIFIFFSKSASLLDTSAAALRFLSMQGLLAALRRQKSGCPVMAFPGIFWFTYIFIPLPRFISYVSDQCSSMSRDLLAAVTLKVGGIFCFLSSILRDPHFMWSHLTQAKSGLGKADCYHQDIPTVVTSLCLGSAELPVGARLLRQLLKL